MAWKWFHRLGSPKWFYEKTTAWLPWLGFISITLILLASIWGLAFGPADVKQGNSARIIYIHVPAAVLAMAGYYVMAISGAIGLIWRMKLSFMVMKAAAPIGAVLTFLALFTGAVWGKPTWGTWWEWDARLTSMLILLLLYLGIIILGLAHSDEKAGAKSVALLAIVGVVNIPIIKYSVNWWNTLHQPATFKLTEKPTMPPEMWVPLLLSVLGLYLLFGWISLYRMQTEVLRRERRTRWVKELVAAGGRSQLKSGGA